MTETSHVPGYLLVIPWDLGEPGGVSQVVSNLYRELGNLGWAPAVLVAAWEAPEPRRDASRQVPVFRWRVRSPWCRGNGTKSLGTYLATLPAFGLKWRQLARRHDWQIVNVHYPGLWAFSWVALKRLGLWKGMVVISVHGREVRDAMHAGGAVERWLMRTLLEQADLVVACSAELADDTVSLAPRARDHMQVIPNGVNPGLLASEFDRNSRLPDELQGRRFILNVATFEHKKSQDVLIGAFARIAARHADVHLVLVGRSTPWLAEIRRQASASGVADRVHFFVDLPHEQVLTFLARATVFCLPSRAEGHPLAILEAAVFALPVVATPVGGIPQTIRNENHGLLVPVGDVHGLSDALNRMLEDPELAGALGRNLKRVVESEFTWTMSAQRYTELITRNDGGEASDA